MRLRLQKKYVYPVVAVVALALAGYLIQRALQEYDLDEIMASLRLISADHLLAGAAFAAGSYLALTGFDTLAVRYTGGRLPYRKIAFVSFTSLSIGHTLGFAAFSTGAVRYRMYTAWGLSPGDVARIILFCGVTVGLGLGMLAAIGALGTPRIAIEALRLPPPVVTAIGVLLLAAILAYLVAAALISRREITIWRFRLPLPPLKLAIGQVVVGTINFLCVSAVLHQMLLASSDIGFFSVAAIYALALTAALITHVPGGLGVIEAVVLSIVPQAEVVGALVAFRVIYFLIPFFIGSALFGLFELSRRMGRAGAQAGVGEAPR